MPILLLLLIFFCTVCEAVTDEKSNASHIVKNQKPGNKRKCNTYPVSPENFTIKKRRNECCVISEANASKIKYFKLTKRSYAVKRLLDVIKRHDPNCQDFHSAEALAFISGGSFNDKGTLRVIADQVIKTDLSGRDWTALHLSTLANALSKMNYDYVVQKALKSIARQVINTDLSGDDWKAQPLAMLANGLSKMDSDYVVQKALKKIAHRVVGTDLSGKYWTEQPLSMLANALSKAEGDDVQNALKNIARHVTKTNIRFWTAQSLAMLVNGLSKAASDNDIKDALKNVARQVTKTNLSRWQEQDLTMMANALSKAEDTDAQEALKNIARQVTKTDLSGKNWTMQHLTMMANALSKAEDADAQEALKNIARQLLKTNLSVWAVKNLAIMANGLSKAYRDDDVQDALKDIAYQMVKKDLSRSLVKDLVMLTNGLSKANGQRVTQALKKIAVHVVKTVLSLKDWTEYHLAMLANGLSKVEGDDDVQDALKNIARQVAKTDLSHWLIKHLAIMANALSKADGQRVTDALNNIAYQVTKMNLSAWPEKHLSMVANAMSKVNGQQVTQTLKNIARHLTKIDMSVWSEESLAVMTNALSKANGQSITQARQKIARKVAKTDLSNWSVESLARVANGLSKAYRDDVQGALKNIARQVAKTDLSVWLVKHLAMMTNGVSKLNDDNDVQGALKNIACQVTKADLSGKDWTAHHLAVIANGLSKWHSYTSEALVIKLIKAYNEFCHQDDHYGLFLLKSLCQMTLSLDDSIEEGINLAFSLIGSRELLNESCNAWFCWCITLLRFAILEKQGNKYVNDKTTLLFEHLNTLDRIDCLDYQRDYKTDYETDSWQILFAKIYYKGITPELKKIQKIQPTQKMVKISRTQNNTLKKIKENVKEKINKKRVTFVSEKLIMLFPVDIYIKTETSSKGLCIEVDGPSHFLEDDNGIGYERAKHRFSKKIIREILGYQLLSIHYRDVNRKKLDHFTDSVAKFINGEK